jgi:pyruvate,water dikinase
MRLFGQLYNDLLQPRDPFEFMDLLVGAQMVSTARNQMLEVLASYIREDRRLEACLRQKGLDHCDASFREAFDAICDKFGDLSWGEARFGQDSRKILDLLLEMASRPAPKGSSRLKDVKKLQEKFLSCFHRDQRSFGVEVIDLARASYRFRDDDNTYLGKIEGQLLAALGEGKRRIGERCKMDAGSVEAKQVVRALRNVNEIPAVCQIPKEDQIEGDFKIKARQLVGQPAGAGIAFGTARVVMDSSDLFQFKTGEILVCDAVDPNMTFVVPLAAGIVERRGGMLIHGAIIAREYAIPCVTGVADAASAIKTGDKITVDGYLGIVIIGEPTMR